jgi:two-component system, NarL family, response regulator DevR
VLLADPHQGVSDSTRMLLSTMFEAVVMVADEVSLFESADRLHSDLAVVDLALARGNAIELVRKLRARCPDLKIIVTSTFDEPSIGRSMLDAGADGFLVKRAIGTDLLQVADAVLAGKAYVAAGATESPAR